MLIENKKKHKRDLSLLTSPALPKIEPSVKVGNNQLIDKFTQVKKIKRIN